MAVVGTVDNDEEVSAHLPTDDQLALVQVQTPVSSVEMSDCSVTGTVGGVISTWVLEGLGSSSGTEMTGSGVTGSSCGLSTDSRI